ncbi:MAG: cupin domain-containing protein [Chloroflexi bacterium]|nr:MAG: cupin domain-containing protein [Chloroflexota bacterium]
MRIDHADAHRRIMAAMQIEHRPHSGPSPDPATIERSLRREARDVYGWSNAPDDRYGEHEHSYTKLLYCTRGSIDFVLSDGRRITLRPGDRLILPPRTRHSAVVGPAGCACLEGKLEA